MSAETYAALQQAITAHVMDEMEEPADIVRDWVMVAAVSNIDDDGTMAEIVVHKAPSTALYSVTGLLHWGAQAYNEVEF